MESLCYTVSMDSLTPSNRSMTYGPHKNKSIIEPTSRGKFAHDVKEAFHAAFLALQNSKDYSLIAWAKKHPTEFYKLAQRFIPADVNVQGNISLSVITGVPGVDEAIEGEIVESAPSDLDLGAGGVGDAHGDSAVCGIKANLQEDDGSDLV